ncbi:ComEC/Rec2 family competence protein [Agrobacterium pusense]|uniref:ComEC/Rec2 family competence protein n=1 Tax=Agrobacterium pusense TaxID=648995 RepID=UPI00384C39E2
MNDVLILDVGHGNCTLVQDAGAVAVIDSPVGSTLIDTLDELGVTHVDHAIISHADADHIAGILALLTSDRITVGELHLNPDRDRQSSIWKDLICAVQVASRSGGFHTNTSLTASTPGILRVGGITMTIVSPSAGLALSAVGGSIEGKANSANTLSAVIKVERAPDVGVLLAGDLDITALSDITASGAKLTASALVFPHHGGLPGSSKTVDFTQTLLEMVGAKYVYVSNGRSRHNNPRGEIVETILNHGCKLACTQLAKACGEPMPSAHHERWPAAGINTRHSCAGTISLTLGEGGAIRDPRSEEAFREFVVTRVSAAMCLRRKS